VNKEKYKERTQITFSLPFELKECALNTVDNINKKLNSNLNLSRFCVNSLKLNCKVNKVKKFDDFKEVFNDIFVNNNMLSLKEKFEILKEFEKLIKAYSDELEDYFKFKEDLNEKDKKEFEKFEELGLLPSAYYILKRQRDESNK
jgi:hypothetical protein